MANEKQKILVIFFTVLIALTMVFSIEINSAEASGKLKTPVIKTIENVDDLEIKLAWGKVTGAQKYYIYRATSKNGTYRRIASVSKSKRSYTDTTIKNQTTYYYKIKAIASVYRNNSRLSMCKSQSVNFTGEMLFNPSGTEQILQKGQVWSFDCELDDIQNWGNDNSYSSLDLVVTPEKDVSDFLKVRLIDNNSPQEGRYKAVIMVTDIPEEEYVDLYFYIKGHKNLYKEEYRIYFDTDMGTQYLHWPLVPDFGSLVGVAPSYVECFNGIEEVFVYDKRKIREALVDMNYDTMDNIKANGGQRILDWWVYNLERNGYEYIGTENNDSVPMYYFVRHFGEDTKFDTNDDYDVQVAIGFDSTKNDDCILVQILFRE